MKIPKEAKKVFDGIIFDTYQWEQELYDGSYATFERLDRADTALVYAMNEKGEILLARQQQPGGLEQLSGLGGRMEPGESPEEAVKRELLEESGYVADDYKLWFEWEPLEKIDWTVYIFVAKNAKKVQEPELEPGEKIDLKWATFDELVNNLIYKEDFRDFEIVLRILRDKNDPKKFVELKKLFSP